FHNKKITLNWRARSSTLYVSKPRGYRCWRSETRSVNRDPGANSMSEPLVVNVIPISRPAAAPAPAPMAAPLPPPRSPPIKPPTADPTSADSRAFLLEDLPIALPSSSTFFTPWEFVTRSEEHTSELQ